MNVGRFHQVTLDNVQFVQCVLSLLIIFNRRRIGDVQYMKISDYKNEQKSNFKDFEDALSKTEKVLATRYRRVLNSGKGSRAVVVLIPEDINKFIHVFLQHRRQHFCEDNDYLFSIPGHKVKWGRGDLAIRNLTKRMPLKNPAAITSNCLRKQIATVMQILSLSKGDIKQFSNFMGHTVKTHEEFYELPVDVYQTAKVSKLLLMIENGVPVHHKGKSLSEIDIDFKYAEENDLKGLKSNYDDEVRNKDVDEDMEIEESYQNQLEGEMGNSKEEEGVERCTDEEEVKNEEDSSSLSRDESKAKSKRTSNIIEKDLASKSSRNGKKKMRWSPEEVSLLEKAFHKYLNKNINPSTDEIRIFLDNNNISRNPVVVTSRLQHLLKLRKQKN